MISEDNRIYNLINSFRFRLLSIVLLGIGLVSVSFYFYSINNQRNLFHESFDKSADKTLQTVKIGIELGLSLENYETINTIFSWTKNDSSVEFIVLTDESGVFATYPENLKMDLNTMDSLKLSSNSILLKSIIWKSKFGNGKIHMGFSTKTIQIYEKKTLKELFLISLIFTLIALIVVFILSSGISRPMKNLQVISDSIREGNFSARAEIKSGSNEIRSVAKAFNLMVTELTDYQEKTEKDLSKAASFVENLLPQKISSPVQIDWIFKPSDKLGGDTFGYHFIDDKNLAIYLLDVSGHGIGAALYSVSVINLLKEESLPNTNFKNPSNLLESLNRIFQIDKYDNKYFTIWYGIYNIEEKSLIYSSAGHPPALLLKNNSEILELNEGNMFIGAFEGTDYPSQSVNISTGDKLYIFSDGLIEFIKENKKLFTVEELKTILINHGKEFNDLKNMTDFLSKLKTDDYLQDDISAMELRF